jgi:hypothetical protein
MIAHRRDLAADDICLAERALLGDEQQAGGDVVGRNPR